MSTSHDSSFPSATKKATSEPRTYGSRHGGVWNPWEEAIAFKTLEQFRRSLGEDRSVQVAPGHFFRHDELVESMCCLLPAMTVGWDAYYVPTWAAGGLDHFLCVSHDGFIEIQVRTHEMHDEVNKILDDRGWIAELTSSVFGRPDGT